MIKPLLQNVVVAYNGSRSSLHAVMYAIMMAKLYHCRVKVVYVVDSAGVKQLSLSKFIVSDEAATMIENLHSDGKRNIEYVKELALKKNVKIETEIREGSVWSEIIKSSDEFNANLILLGGTSGSNGDDSKRSVLRHDTISAQDSEIIGSSHCNVMVVKEPFIEQLFKLA